jgi:hypothetical protein
MLIRRNRQTNDFELKSIPVAELQS